MVITSFLNRVIFLGGCVGKIIKGEFYSFGEFVLNGGVGLVPEGATSEALNVPVFLEGASPVGFPVGPGFVSFRAVIPLLPCIGEVAALDGMLSPSGNHGGLRDGYPSIGGKVLAILLLSGVDR